MTRALRKADALIAAIARYRRRGLPRVRISVSWPGYEWRIR